MKKKCMRFFASAFVLLSLLSLGSVLAYASCGNNPCRENTGYSCFDNFCVNNFHNEATQHYSNYSHHSQRGHHNVHNQHNQHNQHC